MANFHFCQKVANFPDGYHNAASTAHGARSAAATELRRSRCCDGAAQTSSVALILRVATATELMLLRRS